MSIKWLIYVAAFLFGIIMMVVGITVGSFSLVGSSVIIGIVLYFLRSKLS